MSTAPSVEPLSQDDQNNVQHDYWVMWHHWDQLWHHVTLSVVNGTTAFHRSKQSHWSATFDATFTGISVTWCHQIHQWYHFIQQVKTTTMGCNMSIWFMLCHSCLHQCHVIQMVPLMAPLHFLGQDIEMRCNITFQQMTPLALILISHAAKSVVGGTTVFLKTTEIRCNMFLVMWDHWYWHPHCVMPTTLTMVSLHFFSQDNQNEVQHDFLLVMWPNNVVYMLTSHYCTYR